MISIIHPSRGRPEKSAKTIHNWMKSRSKCGVKVEFIVSLDEDDPSVDEYERMHRFTGKEFRHYVSANKSAVDAINSAAQAAFGDVFIVVSDDTEPISCWDCVLENELNGKSDFIVKTKDGIQDYIITFPILDRTYYNRTGYIYHPEFQHLFCDTYLTCVADITGRKITSNLMFKHDHYSVNGTEPDDLHKRNDATWKQGQETFIRLMKQFSPQERARIKDPGMRSWLRNHGV